MKKITKISLVLVIILICNCLSFAVIGCTSQEPDVDLSFCDKTLCNKNATKEAIKLYEYICDTYKKGIISGQQESTWMDSADYEVNYIYENTGKYPAIRGFDFIEDDFDGVVDRAIEWAHKGGIVTICWHCSPSLDGGYKDSKKNLSRKKWNAILTAGTDENIAFLKNMDKAGQALKRLQDENIPVIWRPYHECDGWWFWWSKRGGDYFKRLWVMSYEHFTNDLQLNNLIWMLGFCYAGLSIPKYYPGSEYCDIVGADSYNVSTKGAEPKLYKKVYKLVGETKPIAFHETGLIPTVDQFKDVPWAYFMTWHTTFLTEDNSKEALNALYNNPYVITLEDLPDLYSA